MKWEKKRKKECEQNNTWGSVKSWNPEEGLTAGNATQELDSWLWLFHCNPWHGLSAVIMYNDIPLTSGFKNPISVNYKDIKKIDYPRLIGNRRSALARGCWGDEKVVEGWAKKKKKKEVMDANNSMVIVGDWWRVQGR